MSEFYEKPFLSIEQAVEQATESRKGINPDNVPKYHIPFYDRLLFGIARSELVVIGADTGAGKSSMANHIAYENAKTGKNVYLFSLEGHRNEVINRLKWQVICREYYNNPRGLPMEYNRYEMNAIDGIEAEDAIASEEIKNTAKNLHIFNRKTTLDVAVLTKALSGIDDADLIVIDHLHYFDMLDEKTEAQNITEIMKTIKDQTEGYHQTPVVMISHLRKKDAKRGLPDNEDFMGSSNIPKIATTCLMLSSYDDQTDAGKENLRKGIYGTVLRITKSRAGAPTRYAGLVGFDRKRHCYAKGFTLGQVSSGKFVEISPRDWPYWMKSENPTIEEMRIMHGI